MGRVGGGVGGVGGDRLEGERGGTLRDVTVGWSRLEGGDDSGMSV